MKLTGLRPAGSENLSAARLARRCSLGDKLGREAVSGMLEGGGLSAGCLSGDDRKLKIAFMVTETGEDTGDTKKLKLKWLFEQKKGATNGRKRGL